MTEITAIELKAIEERKGRGQWVDVRSATEYAAGHLPGAFNIPMDQIEARLSDLRRDLPVVLICQSGKRARMVAGLLQPWREDVVVLDGGTAAWTKAGFPIVSNTRTRWALERQVRLLAGSVVLVSAVLAVTLNPYWLYLSGFVGLGLTFAGLTDFCPMAILLCKMPWNRQSQCRAAISTANGGACCS